MLKYVKRAGMIIGGLGLIGLLSFIIIQFVPVDQSNPPVVSEPKWDSSQTQALVERACYDCHSNQTKWTWYSKIAPFSWYLAHDVQEGRAALNFSEWGANKGEGEEGKDREGSERDGPDEMVEEISRGKMPPQQYLLLHPEARLSNAEIEALIAGLKATLGSGAEGAMRN